MWAAGLQIVFGIFHFKHFDTQHRQSSGIHCTSRSGQYVINEDLERWKFKEFSHEVSHPGGLSVRILPGWGIRDQY